MEIVQALLQKRLPHVGATTIADKLMFVQSITKAVNYARAVQCTADVMVVKKYHDRIEFILAWAKSIVSSLQLDGETLLVKANPVDVHWESDGDDPSGMTGEMVKITISVRK